jgi:hypothetical protein
VTMSGRELVSVSNLPTVSVRKLFSLSVTVLLLGVSFGAGAVARPAAVNGPRRISAASPYPAGCGLDMSAKGFGDDVIDAEAEPSLSVDPGDPRALVAAWMQDLYQGYATAWSKNGGSTWTTVTVPGISACTGSEYELAADPWLSPGPDGTTYLAGISLDIPETAPFLPFRSRLQVSRSTDGGRSWSEPAAVVAGTGRLHDKPSLVADPRISGRAYIVWTEWLTPTGPPADGIHFSRTVDGGRTWSPPARLNFPMPQGSNPLGALILVLPGGELLSLTTMRAPNGTTLPHRILAIRSADGGDTWSPATTVAEFPATDPRHSTPWDDPETGEPIAAPEWAISAAAGPDGSVYVTWRHASVTGTADIRFAKSDDGGISWNGPGTIASVGAQMFLPVIAVSGDGTVGATYYDVRRDVLGDAAYTTDLWFAHSHDGGATWQETHVGGSFDLRSALLRKIPIRGRWVGEYHGLVPLRGGFGAAFALAKPKARVGGSDIFFARLRTSPSRKDS